MAQPGDVTAKTPHYTPTNLAVIRTWNRMGGEIRYPDVLYLLVREEVEDWSLALEQLDALHAELSRNGKPQNHRRR